MLLVTRGIVVASTVIAALVELYLVEHAPSIFWFGLGGFVLLLAVGARFRTQALTILMPAMYLSPAILLLLGIGADFSKDMVWVVPLVGLCLSGPRVLEW